MQLADTELQVAEDETWTRINAARMGYGAGYLSTTSIKGFPALEFRQRGNDRNMNNPHVQNLVSSYSENCRRAEMGNAIPIGLKSTECDFSKLKAEHKPGTMPPKLELTGTLETIQPFGGQHRAEALKRYVDSLKGLSKVAESKLKQLVDEQEEEKDEERKAEMEVSIEVAKERVQKLEEDKKYGYMWDFVVYDIGKWIFE